MTDHIAFNSHKLLQLEDELREVRRQNEKFERPAIYT